MEKISSLASEVVALATTMNRPLATAESCTGGLIGGALTRISGSSAAYEGGLITYSNEAKRDLLGVPWNTLLEKGAVSSQVAEEMAAGAIKKWTDVRIFRFQ